MSRFSYVFMFSTRRWHSYVNRKVGVILGSSVKGQLVVVLSHFCL